METIRVKLTEAFFTNFFGSPHSILYAQSENLKNVCFFAKKIEEKCFIEKRQVIQKFFKIEDFLPEHKKVLEGLPDEILLEESCFEEEYDLIE
jgi:hypothetical protein